MDIQEWSTRFADLLRRSRVALVGVPLSMLVSTVVFGVGVWYLESRHGLTPASVMVLFAVVPLPMVGFIAWMNWYYGRRPSAGRRPWDDPN